MAHFRILMSNLGYLRGISGSLKHHILYAHRNVYVSTKVQKKAIIQLMDLIKREDPDLCCFVEIDQGSFHSANFNQLEALANHHYPYFDVENKYGKNSHLRRFSITSGKSNGFLTKQKLPYEKLYFVHGTKRLIYKIMLADNITLFFSHFSLKSTTRSKQFLEVKQLLENTKGEFIFLGDFNILNGFSELQPLLENKNFVLMNKEDHPTFTFHTTKKVLDICICSKNLASSLDLKIIPQHYSDHAALMIELNLPA